MPRRLRPFLLMISILAAFAGSNHAQTLERVTLYRDAAVVTWASELTAGDCPLARSLSPLSMERVTVYPANSGQALGAMSNVEFPWSGSDGTTLKLAEDRMEVLRLDVALKEAQLALVEEDLAVLRANRSIGGTAESLLVEDLEEMADWMHDAFREMLYRRVELQEELAALERERKEVENAVRGAAPTAAFAWSVRVPEGQEGTVRTQVIEPSGAGWAPADILELTPDGRSSVLHQRIRYWLSLPTNGSAEVVFVDEWWNEAGAGSPVEAISVGYEMPKGKVKRNGGSVYNGIQQDAVRGSRARFRTNQALEMGPASGGMVSVGQWTADFAGMAHSVPHRAEVVEWQHVASVSGQSWVASDRLQMVIGGLPAGDGRTELDGDSLRVMTGVDERWSISRSEESALCSRSSLGGRVRHHRAYAIRITNGSEVDGKVRIAEPLPRSRELEIELNPDNLDGGVIDSVNEAVFWMVTLKAGESRTLRFSYDVEHDRDQHIPGFH